MIQFKIRLETHKLGELNFFGGDFFDLCYNKKTCFIHSTDGDSQMLFTLPVLSGDEEEVTIRLPRTMFTKLKQEAMVLISVLDNSIKLVFFTAKDSFLYELDIQKQYGYPENIEEKIQILNSLKNYRSVTSSVFSGIVDTLATLNTKLCCFDNVLFGEFERSYILKKQSCPNFCIPAKTLKKLCRDCSSIYFVQSYLYGAMKEGDIHIFLKTHRIVECLDMQYLLKSKFNMCIELDTSSVPSFTSKYRPRVSYALDIKNKCLHFNDGDRSGKINCPVIDVKSVNDNKEDDIDVNDIVSLLTSNADSEQTIIGKHSPSPSIEIPSWVVNTCFISGKVKLYLNNSFVLLNNGKFRIVFSRRDFIENQTK